jgi:hypothetical protein
MNNGLFLGLRTNYEILRLIKPDHSLICIRINVLGLVTGRITEVL